MKPLRPLSLFLSFFFILLTPILAEEDHKLTKSPSDETSEGVFRHVVLFEFKEGTTAEQIQEIEKDFANLPSEIETIIDFEWGRNVNTKSSSQGHSHCFLVTFADKAGLEIYLPHPAHKKFVSKIKPLLEKVTVVDYILK